MRTEWDFSGRWLGLYRYDPTPLFSQPMPVVPFMLTLKRTWLGKLRGRVQDDAEVGMPEWGVVQGQVRGLEIEFVKLMPVCYMMINGQMVRYSQHLGLDYELPHPAIRYQGSYSPTEETVRGTWNLATQKIRLRTGGSVIVQQFAGITGTWEMRRHVEAIAMEP